MIYRFIICIWLFPYIRLILMVNEVIIIVFDRSIFCTIFYCLINI